jgi:hypothetical protein
MSACVAHNWCLAGFQTSHANDIKTYSSELFSTALLRLQFPEQFPRWILDSTAALESCRAAAGFTCPTSAPIAMINSTDVGSSLPLLGCIAGTSCPAAAPANAVPTTEAYTLFSLTSSGAVVECRPAATSPSNACNGNVSVVDATGIVVGCTQSTSCPTSFYELYAARSAQDNTAVLTSCVATQPECSQNSVFNTPVYNSTLGAANVAMAGCKAAKAACPPSASFMTLSATSLTATQPTIEACYKSYAAGTTCPRTGRHTVPLCTWSSIIATSCTGAQVQGCMGSGSTRCFSSSAAGNVDRAYPFVVGSVGGTPPQVTSLLACYHRPVPTSSVPSCPVATPVKRCGLQARPVRVSAWTLPTAASRGGLRIMATLMQAACALCDLVWHVCRMHEPKLFVQSRCICPVLGNHPQLCMTLCHLTLVWCSGDEHLGVICVAC